MEDPSYARFQKERDLLSNLAGKKVFIQSFGCALNHADSLRIEGMLKKLGATITSEGTAEAVLVNTCTVVKKTEHKVLRFLRDHMDKELHVMGCMASIQPKEIRSVCYPHIIPYSLLRTFQVPLAARINDVIGLIPISHGCSGQCTYCIAKKARGGLQSEPADEICEAISDLVSTGVREIQITAQDVSSWGLDRDLVLPNLLERMLSLPGHFRLRLGMMNPATLIPFVHEMHTFYGHEKIYAFAHIPVQSGSDEILGLMKREYAAQDFIQMIRTLREGNPDIWIATDVIVGFPEETEKHFQETLDLVRQVRPNKVNITRYSPRPGTEASKLSDILERTKKDRSRRLSRLADQICMDNNRAWIGKVVPIVGVECIKPGTIVCRTPQYRSVMIREDLPLGYKGFAYITGARIHYLTGIRVK